MCGHCRLPVRGSGPASLRAPPARPSRCSPGPALGALEFPFPLPLRCRGMIGALGRCRARWALSVPGPRRGLARPRNTDGAEPVGGKPIPFSGSKASPRFWSVSRSMGSDHERPLVKVLSLSVLCTGLLLWCVFRGRTEFDERLEKEVLPGQIVDSSDTAKERNAPLQLQKS